MHEKIVYQTFHSYFLNSWEFIESCDCIYSRFFESGSFGNLLLSDDGFSAWKLRLYPFQAIFWIKLGYSRAFIALEALAHLKKVLKFIFTAIYVPFWISKSNFESQNRLTEHLRCSRSDFKNNSREKLQNRYFENCLFFSNLFSNVCFEDLKTARRKSFVSIFDLKHGINRLNFILKSRKR